MHTRSTIPTGATAQQGQAGAAVQDAPTPRGGKSNKPATKNRVAETTVVETPMTTVELTTLGLLEAVIDKGLHTFLDVGNALLRIRDERLYRGTHTAFDAYCRDRWGMSKTQANRFIAASSVAKNLAPIGVTPTSESQIRLLCQFEPAKQVKVFERAAKTSGGADKVTAKSIEQAATKMHLIQPTRAHASTADDRVERKEVQKAVKVWAEEKWEEVSKLSVADFLREIAKVIRSVE